jgi:hypothetical protein
MISPWLTNYKSGLIFGNLPKSANSQPTRITIMKDLLIAQIVSGIKKDGRCPGKCSIVKK